MKVAVFAGGYGSRLEEETKAKPKPLVEVGGMPILCHVLNGYSACGFNEFVIALGYKADEIKHYFIRRMQAQDDLALDFGRSSVEALDRDRPDWKVHLVDTGAGTPTGGRLYQLRDRLAGCAFMATYSDGLSDIDFRRLLEFHRFHGKLATVSLVKPRPRFGIVETEGDRVTSFREKADDGRRVSGGFFVFEPGVLERLDPGSGMLEQELLPCLAEEGQLMGYRHGGFWDCMDTKRDQSVLEELWASGQAPWLR